MTSSGLTVPAHFDTSYPMETALSTQRIIALITGAATYENQGSM